MVKDHEVVWGGGGGCWGLRRRVVKFWGLGLWDSLKIMPMQSPTGTPIPKGPCTQQLGFGNRNCSRGVG